MVIVSIGIRRGLGFESPSFLSLWLFFVWNDDNLSKFENEITQKMENSPYGFLQSCISPALLEEPNLAGHYPAIISRPVLFGGLWNFPDSFHSCRARSIAGRLT